MAEQRTSSKIRTAVGWTLIGLGIAVFLVRLFHAGAYAMPRGTNLLGGLGGILLGAALLWTSAPRWFRWPALAASPVVLFAGIFATMSELEEVVSLYATDSAGRPAELRLWIVDREDGAWVGMPRWKAIEHSLDGSRVELLRRGETLCVSPLLHEDRPTVRAIHALKVAKYAVARAAASVGLYPREARETSVSLRLDPCTGG